MWRCINGKSPCSLVLKSLMGKRELLFFVCRDCCVALPHGAIGLSVVCDCGISKYFVRFINNRRESCFALFVFLVSRNCCVALPHDAMGLSVVCDCGISKYFCAFYQQQNIGRSILVFNNLTEEERSAWLIISCVSSSRCPWISPLSVAVAFHDHTHMFNVFRCLKECRVSGSLH